MSSSTGHSQLFGSLLVRHTIGTGGTLYVAHPDTVGTHLVEAATLRSAVGECLTCPCIGDIRASAALSASAVTVWDTVFEFRTLGSISHICAPIARSTVAGTCLNTILWLLARGFLTEIYTVDTMAVPTKAGSVAVIVVFANAFDFGSKGLAVFATAIADLAFAFDNWRCCPVLFEAREGRA